MQEEHPVGGVSPKHPQKTFMGIDRNSPGSIQIRQLVHHKNLDDQETRQLLHELDYLTTLSRDKQRKIEKLSEENNKLKTRAEDVDRNIKKVSEDIEHLREKQRSSSQHEEEEQKNDQEEEEEMKHIMRAIGLQAQGLSSLSGLSAAAIAGIPSFAFEKGSEPEICLSCFQELEQGSNIKCLPCCHLFHENCIGQHLRNSKYCPACSEEVILM